MRKTLLSTVLILALPSIACAGGVLGVGAGTGPGGGNQAFINAGKVSPGIINSGLEIHFGSGTGGIEPFFLAPQVSLGVGSGSGSWRAYALAKKYVVGGERPRIDRFGYGLAFGLPWTPRGFQAAVERTGNGDYETEGNLGAWLAQLRVAL